MDDAARWNIPTDNAGETTPGGQQEAKWVAVMKTAGLLPAQIIADSLQAQGIPAHAWQEGAGRALGLMVGVLGIGYVMVPESHEEAARNFLASLDDITEEE
jgi:hypothetical protein